MGEASVGPGFREISLPVWQPVSQVCALTLVPWSNRGHRLDKFQRQGEVTVPFGRNFAKEMAELAKCVMMNHQSFCLSHDSLCCYLWPGKGEAERQKTRYLCDTVETWPGVALWDTVDVRG